MKKKLVKSSIAPKQVGTSGYKTLVGTDFWTFINLGNYALVSWQ